MQNTMMDLVAKPRQRAHDRGDLQLHGKLKHLTDPQNFNRWLNATVSKDWVVYAKRPFGGPEVVLKYLARYTHRVAISNHRLRALKDGRVTFAVKDYANKGRRGVMTLAAPEFLRRFLQHVLPKGFMRIRHFGWMANRVRKTKITQCRQLLMMKTAQRTQEETDRSKIAQDNACPNEQSKDKHETSACSKCQRGKLLVTRFDRIDQLHRNLLPTSGPAKNLSKFVAIPKIDDSS
jgi:hypothetical protein